MARKKNKRIVTHGVAHVQTTFNNTIVTITDNGGNTLCWTSAGTLGFKGSKKNTSFAAQSVAQNVALKALEFGIETVEVIIKGCGNGRESAIRSLQSAGLLLLSIEDRTSIAHNGCRPLKKRRL